MYHKLKLQTIDITHLQSQCNLLQYRDLLLSITISMSAGGLKHVIELEQASEPVILDDPSFFHSLTMVPSE